MVLKILLLHTPEQLKTFENALIKNLLYLEFPLWADHYISVFSYITRI